MDEQTVEKLIDAMKRPTCKMVSLLMMSALASTGIEQKELNDKIESIGPFLGKLSNESEQPFGAIFSTNMIVWALPEDIRSGFFAGDDLSLEGMMEIAQTGINDWHEVVRNGNVEVEDVQNFFRGIKELLIELVGDLAHENAFVTQIISVQDRVIESFEM